MVDLTKLSAQTFSDREKQQMTVACWYAETHPSAGIPGHTLLLLIAKLVKLLLEELLFEEDEE